MELTKDEKDGKYRIKASSSEGDLSFKTAEGSLGQVPTLVEIDCLGVELEALEQEVVEERKSRE